MREPSEEALEAGKLAIYAYTGLPDREPAICCAKALALEVWRAMHPVDIRYTRRGKATLMAEVDGWCMYRTPSKAPAIMHKSDWDRLPKTRPPEEMVGIQMTDVSRLKDLND